MRIFHFLEQMIYCICEFGIKLQKMRILVYKIQQPTQFWFFGVLFNEKPDYFWKLKSHILATLYGLPLVGDLYLESSRVNPT